MTTLIVANWKMEFTHNQALSWIEKQIHPLETVLSKKSTSLVICPSYTVLPCTPSLKKISWGAQNCGLYEQGAYTGDVSVLSLKELSCNYCIVGHSEQRIYHGETDIMVAQKAALLLDHGIQPIICIGEKTANDPFKKDLLETQMKALLSFKRSLIIAYEPVWAIGTGITPSIDNAAPLIEHIRSYAYAHGVTAQVLYGGSVNEHSALAYKGVVDGFLLGKASLDAELLKKIILLC